MNACLYNPHQGLQDTIAMLTNRIAILEKTIENLPITLKNIPIFLQNFSVSCSGASVQYATVSANPSNIAGNRVWNFYLSLILQPSSNTVYTLVYDFSDVKSDIIVTFEDAVSGTVVYMNNIFNASEIIIPPPTPYGYLEEGRTLTFNVALPSAPVSQESLQFNIVLNDH